MLRRFSTLVLLALLALGGRPASAANREHQQMMADIRMLQEQTQQLQLQLAALAEVLKTVTAKIDEQSGVTRKAFADQKVLIDTISNDLRAVREKADDTTVRLSNLSQDVEAMRLAIPQQAPGQPTPPVGSPGQPGDQSLQPGTNQAVPPAQPAAPGVPPQQLFQQAWADYTAGQWSLAIQGFDAYIKTFPKSEQAGDAQYYIGEAYYGDGKFRDAVAAYDKAISDYPSSKQVPGAYYKRGMALEQLGQLTQARQSYEGVIKNFPNSDAATLARQALDRLNKLIKR